MTDGRLFFAKMPQAAAAEMLITKGDAAAARQPAMMVFSLTTHEINLCL
jgi:hypothetical protein